MGISWEEFERIESLAIALLAASVFFEVVEGSAILFLILILAPDILMVGYLKNEEIGALIYNSFHNYLLPAVFLISGFLTGHILIQQIALRGYNPLFLLYQVWMEDFYLYSVWGF